VIRRAIRGRSSLFVLSIASAIGCHRADSMTSLEGGCRSCHGGNDNAAPPRAVDGSTDTHAIGVGAHQTHLIGGLLSHPVACSECHVVPKAANDPGHMDHPLPAYVIWGDLAKQGTMPAWDRDQAACSNTYCHGATLTGGSNTSPKWTVVDGSQEACGTCHGLPPPAPHPPGLACEACHAPVAGPNLTIATPTRHIDGVLDVTTPDNRSDPAHNMVITGLIPSYSGTSIASLTPLTQTLTMQMNHKSTAVPSAAFSSCGNCHMDAASGVYFPGLMHATLRDLGLAQPTVCTDCHSGTRPVGFVGALATMPARTPPSGEMKHDAVLWAGGAPTTMPAVPDNCSPCHVAGGAPTWASSPGANVVFHASLSASAQPSSCLDCHANSRPGLLGASNSSVPMGLAFDHRSPQAMQDCQTCHAASAPGFTTWAGGRFHQKGAAAPSSCLPCHDGERPTTTQGWVSTTYQSSPFDYTANSLNDTHGAGQDCADCHSNPGTGHWGVDQNWAAGHFPHGPSTLAGTTCVSCHSTQRPDLLPGATAAGMAMLLGFDHSINGRGDCVGCHQATVMAGSYVNLDNPANNMLPGGDWKGGIGYPGSFLVSSTTKFITADEIVLDRSGPNNLVTGTSPRTSMYPNAFLHTSSQVPAAVNAGPTGSPDNSKCWHCHANNAGMITSLSDGVFHASLDNYQAMVGGPVTRLPQPTVCRDCHTARPRDIVELSSSDLITMDHAAPFTATVNIGGVMASSAADLDCSTCHQAAGLTSWADGLFHPSIGAAIPADCTTCHYPLMADGARADLTSVTRYQMQHRSAQITFQKCSTCHTTAFGRSAMMPADASRWNPGAYHASIGAQPSQCSECHGVAQPASSTQGTISYSLAMGMTTTNQLQWMNHASSALGGKDCASCHAADATSSASAFSKTTKFHGVVASVTTCRECHGLANGKGSSVGADNNMPSGLTDSSVVTSADSTTGVAAGTHDQISHADINVSANDCALCHTQQGPSTAAGVQGKEWTQARFHQNFSANTPLVLNGSTGRCSNCHINVKPTSVFSTDHSAYTATSPTDCSSCHTWPGTNPATPNWLGAKGAHASSGSTAGSTLDCSTCHGMNGSSSMRLAVPTASHFGGTSDGNTCISCHVDFTAFSGTVSVTKYTHTNSAANASGCQMCHQYQGGLYTTLTTTPILQYPTTSGGHQFSQSHQVTARQQTSSHTDSSFTSCGACHQYTTTTSGTTVWTYVHDPSNPGINNSRSSNGCNWCH
jgi:predicted CxxxxCH...CXXCH cytochrome family protein